MLRQSIGRVLFVSHGTIRKRSPPFSSNGSIQLDRPMRSQVSRPSDGTPVDWSKEPSNQQEVPERGSPAHPPPSGPPSSKTNADRFSRTKKEPTVELDLLIGCLQVAGPKKNSIYANTWIDFALILFSLVSFGVGGSIESLKRNAAVSLYLCLWK